MAASTRCSSWKLRWGHSILSDFKNNGLQGVKKVRNGRVAISGGESGNYK
jgi:hypothetical protein